MPTVAERNAAFDVVKKQLTAIVPLMFRGYIKDAEILQLCDAALSAAEQVRVATPKGKNE